MAMRNDLVNKTSAYVTGLYEQKLPAWALYHDITHALQTVEACTEIGQAMGLQKSEQEIVDIAAWFHDVGYTELTEGHEERSVEIASEFLRENGYPQENIDLVAGCIRATRVPQHPDGLLQEVLCDADLVHLGKKTFFERGELLRAEKELHTGKTFSEEEWLNYNIEFVSKFTFHTKYGQAQFARRRARNLIKLQERLRAAMDSSAATQGQPTETLLSTVASKHHQCAMADLQADIIIGTNAIVISILLGLFFVHLKMHPYITIPFYMLLAVCFCTMGLALRATRSKIGPGVATKGNARDPLPLPEQLNKEQHDLDTMLQQKARDLQLSRLVSLGGLIISAIAFAVTLSAW